MNKRIQELQRSNEQLDLKSKRENGESQGVILSLEEEVRNLKEKVDSIIKA